MRTAHCTYPIHASYGQPHRFSCILSDCIRLSLSRGCTKASLAHRRSQWLATFQTEEQDITLPTHNTSKGTEVLIGELTHNFRTGQNDFCSVPPVLLTIVVAIPSEQLALVLRIENFCLLRVVSSSSPCAPLFLFSFFRLFPVLLVSFASDLRYFHQDYQLWLNQSGIPNRLTS